MQSGDITNTKCRLCWIWTIRCSAIIWMPLLFIFALVFLPAASATKLLAESCRMEGCCCYFVTFWIMFALTPLIWAGFIIYGL